MKKRILAIILAIVLCMSLLTITFPNESANSASLAAHDGFDCERMAAFYERMVAQHDAVVFYDRMMESFFVEFGERNGRPARFPENYAGAYVDDDGNLVIQITNNERSRTFVEDNLILYSRFVDFEELRRNDTEIVATSVCEFLLFEEVAFSLNELVEIMDFVVDNFKLKIIEFGVDTYNNTVSIGLDADVYLQVQEQLEVFVDIVGETFFYTDFIENDARVLPVDRDIPIAFRIADSNDFASTRHIGGQGPYIHRLGGRGLTLGFTGRFNNRNVYISAGHGATLNASATFGGRHIGTVTHIQFSPQGSGDWSMITLENSEIIAPRVRRPGMTEGNIVGRINSLPIGTGVMATGQATNRWVAFFIQETGTSFSGHGITVFGLVRAQGDTQWDTLMGGDSGGPFVRPHGASGNYLAAGLLTTAPEGGGRVVQYTPMVWIPSGFTVN